MTTPNLSLRVRLPVTGNDMSKLCDMLCWGWPWGQGKCYGLKLPCLHTVPSRNNSWYKPENYQRDEIMLMQHGVGLENDNTVFDTWWWLMLGRVGCVNELDS